jgi:hypothetical protein
VRQEKEKTSLPTAQMKLPKTKGRAYSTTKEKQELKTESLKEKSPGYRTNWFQNITRTKDLAARVPRKLQHL